MTNAATEPTIEVENSIGKSRHVTKEQFVERWKNYAGQFHTLFPSMSIGEANMISAIVQMRAGQEFDRILAKDEENDLLKELVETFENL